jgi:hypothetical protein
MLIAPELGNLSQLGGSVTKLLSNSCIMFHFVSSIMFVQVYNMIWARLWSYELDEENLNLDINEGLHWPLKLGTSDRYPVTSSRTLSPLSPYSQPSSVQPGNTRTASFEQEESQVINLFWVYCKCKRALIFSWTTAGSGRLAPPGDSIPEKIQPH